MSKTMFVAAIVFTAFTSAIVSSASASDRGALANQDAPMAAIFLK